MEKGLCSTCWLIQAPALWISLCIQFLNPPDTVCRCGQSHPHLAQPGFMSDRFSPLLPLTRFYHQDPALISRGVHNTINLQIWWRMLNSGLDFQSGKLWLSHTPGLWSRKSQRTWQSYSYRHSQAIFCPIKQLLSRWVGSTATPRAVGN